MSSYHSLRPTLYCGSRPKSLPGRESSLVLQINRTSQWRWIPILPSSRRLHDWQLRLMLVIPILSSSHGSCMVCASSFNTASNGADRLQPTTRALPMALSSAQRHTFENDTGKELPSTSWPASLGSAGFICCGPSRHEPECHRTHTRCGYASNVLAGCSRRERKPHLLQQSWGSPIRVTSRDISAESWISRPPGTFEPERKSPFMCRAQVLSRLRETATGETQLFRGEVHDAAHVRLSVGCIVLDDGYGPGGNGTTRHEPHVIHRATGTIGKGQHAGK
jgi:hypothetical protein